ncbi:MAG: lactate utilization protein [Oscillospiraceae bacterium]|nr:lactate utilization protein [Oscillospiraceae bacterium]
MRDEHLDSVIKKRIFKTMDGLAKNGMECYMAETAAEVPDIVKTLIEKGATVASGGSATLNETGVIDLLRSGDYNYLDRSGVSGDAVKKLFRDSLSADVYLSSTNAVTENGELYNVDGNGNRVAALCYGPDSVIIVAGYNKIVANIDEAVRRVKTIAAPANTERLGCDTYCREKGECMSCASGDFRLPSGCRSSGRICCSYVITAHQRVPGRIKVILVAESLGY